MIKIYKKIKLDTDVVLHNRTESTQCVQVDEVLYPLPPLGEMKIKKGTTIVYNSYLLHLNKPLFSKNETRGSETTLPRLYNSRSISWPERFKNLKHKIFRWFHANRIR